MIKMLKVLLRKLRNMLDEMDNFIIETETINK